MHNVLTTTTIVIFPLIRVENKSKIDPMLTKNDLVISGSKITLEVDNFLSYNAIDLPGLSSYIPRSEAVPTNERTGANYWTVTPARFSGQQSLFESLFTHRLPHCPQENF